MGDTPPPATQPQRNPGGGRPPAQTGSWAPPSPACSSQRLCSTLSKMAWQGAQLSDSTALHGREKTITTGGRRVWLTWPQSQAGTGVEGSLSRLHARAPGGR